MSELWSWLASHDVPRGWSWVGMLFMVLSAIHFLGLQFVLFASVASLSAGGHGTGLSLQGKFVCHGNCKTWIHYFRVFVILFARFEYASIANFTLCLAGMIFMRPMLVILAPCYRQNTWHGSSLPTQHITTLWWGLSATTILWPTSDYYSLGLRAMCRMLRKLSLLVSFRSSFFALVS